MSFLYQGYYRIKEQTGKPGQLTIDVCAEYQDIVRKWIKRNLEKEKKSGKEEKLSFIGNPDISKRSLDANACMHHWYKIEAKCLNAGMAGSGQYEITGWQIYEDDLRKYCPKDDIMIKSEFLGMHKRTHRHTHILKQEGEYIYIQLWKTSSHFTIKEMAIWIDRIINRIASYGVPLSVDEQGSIKSDWIEMKKWLAKNKIILHSDEPCTKDEYKDMTPICEASGDFLGNGGEVAHIQAIGMGGKEEPEKDHPGNWWHLKTEIHRNELHGKGIKWFLNKYPWLKYKYNLAMKLADENKEPEQGELL